MRPLLCGTLALPVRRATGTLELPVRQLLRGTLAQPVRQATGTLEPPVRQLLCGTLALPCSMQDPLRRSSTSSGGGLSNVGPVVHCGRKCLADPHTQTKHQPSSSRSHLLATAGPGHPATDMRSLDKAPLHIELAGLVRQLADVDTPTVLPATLVVQTSALSSWSTIPSLSWSVCSASSCAVPSCPRGSRDLSIEVGKFQMLDLELEMIPDLLSGLDVEQVRQRRQGNCPTRHW